MTFLIYHACRSTVTTKPRYFLLKRKHAARIYDSQDKALQASPSTNGRFPRAAGRGHKWKMGKGPNYGPIPVFRVGIKDISLRTMKLSGDWDGSLFSRSPLWWTNKWKMHPMEWDITHNTTMSPGFDIGVTDDNFPLLSLPIVCYRSFPISNFISVWLAECEMSSFSSGLCRTGSTRAQKLQTAFLEKASTMDLTFRRGRTAVKTHLFVECHFRRLPGKWETKFKTILQTGRNAQGFWAVFCAIGVQLVPESWSLA